MIKNKTLKQWTDLIESFNPHEIVLGLERITKVAQTLNLISFDGKVVIIGGTNGKGSCVATLESFAVNSNLSVGCYTSPHLQKFNERIRVNGQDVTDELLLSAFEEIDHARESIALTFFEFTTLVALMIFKQANLDLIILEVGLGGRLDAVNIIEPDASVITTIAQDHEAWLGNDLVGIAFEKSGICGKKSFNLVGDERSHLLVKQARPELSINLADLSDVNHLNLHELVNNSQINPHKLLLQNILCASLVFKKLFNQLWSEIALEKVISLITLRGRFFKLSNEPFVIVDVGHNGQAAENLSHQIKSVNCQGKRYAICGLMADKAINDFLSVMASVIDEWYFVDLPVARAATASDLLVSFKQLNSINNALSISNVALAFEAIMENAELNDHVYVFGSFITVAEMLHYYDKNVNLAN